MTREKEKQTRQTNKTKHTKSSSTYQQHKTQVPPHDNSNEAQKLGKATAAASRLGNKQDRSL